MHADTPGDREGVKKGVTKETLPNSISYSITHFRFGWWGGGGGGSGAALRPISPIYVATLQPIWRGAAFWREFDEISEEVSPR